MSPAELARLQFTSERLTLRSLRQGDEELYCQLFCDPEMMRHIGPAWTRAAAARAFRDSLAAMLATPQRGLFLVLKPKAAAQAAGLCSLQNFELDGRRAELGLMLVPSGRAYGVATEAMIAVLAHAFATLPVDEVWVRFAIDHVAATHTAVGAGLVRHEQARPEDLAANLWRWSAYRDSWRPGARQRSVSVHCSAADE